MGRINVTKSSMPSWEEYCDEIKPIWDTVHLTNMGPIHNRLKEKVGEYLKAENTELFVNGHLALYCAIKVLGLKGEIITTPFTFASTTNAIVQAGCVPVFCDVKADYTIDENKIESLITDKTVAILGVHVYGNICNVDAIDKIATKHGLKVIYDAAHAFGVEYNGRGIGTYGDMSMFSFHATKVFHTIEGGCLTYKDSSLTKKIEKMRNFGVNGEELDCFGTNAKMNEFQAAMGLCNMRHLEDELKLRQAVYEKYTELLSDIDGITLLRIFGKIKQNYAYYPILIDKEKFGYDRDEAANELAKNDIFARKYFYPLTSENREFTTCETVNTPMAKYYSENVLCLPMYAHLDISDVVRICKVISQMRK
ncbi:MAG: DegT/DnrJ/EryC1/StrS family aminotransferase [Eubacteriales bacterium]|nr:DegT/DnrJ/EryC1/StrS family aminotransferase [Eubacteriales bacterium]